MANKKTEEIQAAEEQSNVETTTTDASDAPVDGKPTPDASEAPVDGQTTPDADDKPKATAKASEPETQDAETSSTDGHYFDPTLVDKAPEDKKAEETADSKKAEEPKEKQEAKQAETTSTKTTSTETSAAEVPAEKPTPKPLDAPKTVNYTRFVRIYTQPREGSTYTDYVGAVTFLPDDGQSSFQPVRYVARGIGTKMGYIRRTK